MNSRKINILFFSIFLLLAVQGCTGNISIGQSDSKFFLFDDKSAKEFNIELAIQSQDSILPMLFIAYHLSSGNSSYFEDYFPKSFYLDSLNSYELYAYSFWMDNIYDREDILLKAHKESPKNVYVMNALLDVQIYIYEIELESSGFNAALEARKMDLNELLVSGLEVSNNWTEIANKKQAIIDLE